MLVNRTDEVSPKSFMDGESKTNPLNGLKWVKIENADGILCSVFSVQRKKPTHHSVLKDCLKFVSQIVLPLRM